MKINQDKIENPAALPIESVEVINDNNFSFVSLIFYKIRMI